MASSADRLLTFSRASDALGVELAELLALALELDVSFEQLAVALLEHVRPLVQLLVPREEAALEGAELVAPRACLVLGLALEADLLFLRLEDQLLLRGAGVGDDACGLVLGGLDRLVRPTASRDEADGDTTGQRHEGDGEVFHLFLPSGRRGPDA